MKPVFILLLSLLFLQDARAQDDIMKSLQDSAAKKEYVTGAFKSSRVINGHSVEFIGAGVLDLRILHRFGPVNQGVSQFFGLDQASMRLGFDYGISKNFTIGIGRTTTQKELDGFLKYRPLQQATGPGGSPASIVLVVGMSIQTYKNLDPSKEVSFNLRSGYYYQAIFGRKFSPRFSLQLSPTLVHRNEVASGDINDIFAMGVGGRYKFSKRMAFVVDYFYVTNGLPHSAGSNPLSVGVDIETGGHVFQLHFSNTSGMNERAFITQTTNKWGNGDIQFGFNLSRVFNLKKKKPSAY
jgi:predicted porin